MINIKQGLNSFSLPIMLCLFCYLAFDINERFLPQSNNQSNTMLTSGVSPLAPIGLTASQKNELVNLYAEFSSNKEEEVDTANSMKGLSPEEQLKQQGLLKQIYVGDLVIELKAVIEQVDMQSKQPIRLVLLNVEDIKANTSKVISVADGTLFQDYVITIINNTKVNLSRVDEQNKSSDLMLVMYESFNNQEQ